MLGDGTEWKVERCLPQHIFEAKLNFRFSCNHGTNYISNIHTHTYTIMLEKRRG